jgi:hypothetical protein
MDLANARASRSRRQRKHHSSLRPLNEPAFITALNCSKRPVKKRAQVLAMYTPVAAVESSRAVTDEALAAQLLNTGRMLLKTLDV